MTRLLRFYGFRKAAALLLGGFLAWLAVGVAAWRPPSDWSAWPASAAIALSGLTSGALKISYCGWLVALAWPVLQLRSNVSLLTLLVIAFLGLEKGVIGVWNILQGAFYLAAGADGYAGRVVTTFLGLVLWPAILGAAPLLLVEASEHIQVNAAARRWFVGGQGPATTWIRSPELRRLAKPIQRDANTSAGFLGDGIFAGMSLFEQGIGRRPIWINDNAHVVTCAMTGSGKFTTSLGLNAIFHRGSGVYIAPKPEIANFALGRRVDPTIFERCDASRLGWTLGVDPRGITSARFHLPNGRAFVLDPSGQSVYLSNCYCLLSEIDVRKPNARALLLALATGSFPDRPGSHSDPWYTLAPRGFLAAGCGHVLTTDPDPSHHHVPFVIDRLMGIDPKTNVASPKCFEETLKAMMKNNSLDGFIQSAASNIYQLGEKAFGSLNSELETNCRWATDGYMRRHLSGRSDFKFEWIGRDGYPITIFIIPPRGDAAFQAALPWLRTLSELSLQILQTKADVPSIPTLWVGDEYRQWGDKIAAVRNGATILRDKNVKLWLYTQSWSQIEEMFGVHGAAELESSSTIQLFGVNDLPTAERFSRRLGKWTKREKSRGGRSYRECDLATPAELMQELRLSSNLQYVFPPETLPMRLERVAFKPLRTKDGGVFAGLPLEGHYDDGLTKHSFAARSK